MKPRVSFTAIALIVAATFDSVVGLAKYLNELPNGGSFSEELGHPGSDTSKYTDFATAFADAGHSWTSDFCGQTFPGSSMTNGEAFGDPCCTWAKGGTANFTVTAFTTTPGEVTVCATGGSSAGSSTATSGSTGTETPSSDSPATDTPTVTTETPSTDTPTTGIPATDPPIVSDSASEGSDSSEDWLPSPGGCKVKPNHGGYAWQFRLRH